MTVPIQTTLAQAFRRAALPLWWYYAVALGLPLANGAAQSGPGFVNHALVVLVVPPTLIVLLCVIQKGAQVFDSACRSALYPRSHARSNGTSPDAG